jgi:hypothetical protein
MSDEGDTAESMTLVIEYSREVVSIASSSQWEVVVDFSRLEDLQLDVNLGMDRSKLNFTKWTCKQRCTSGLSQKFATRNQPRLPGEFRTMTHCSGIH